MSAEPPVEEFVTGGYFLVQPFTRHPESPPEFLPPDVVRPPVITVAPCFATVLPSQGLIDLGGRMLDATDRVECEVAAAAWGIPPAQADEVVQWMGERRERGGIHCADAFAHPDVAREFTRRFVPASIDARLLGIGLHRSTAPAFLEAVRRDAGLGPGVAGPPNGVLNAVVSGRPLVCGGRRLGYDVLDVAHGQGRHSWHCHHHERRVRDQWGIRLGAGGMIERFDDAVRIAAACDAQELGCEPGVWRAWIVVEYDR